MRGHAERRASGVDVAALSAGSAGGARSGAGPARRPSQPLYVVTGLSRENPENQYPAGRTLSSHPAVLGWHISNEYGGECHCDLCQNRFRDWLKARYQTLGEPQPCPVEHLLSHTYTDWSQIESPAPQGEMSIHWS